MAIIAIVWVTVTQANSEVLVIEPISQFGDNILYAQRNPITPQPCESIVYNMDGLIRCIADSYGVNSTLAVRVASCESGLRPNAFNSSGASGLFQQMNKEPWLYWQGRLERYGYDSTISPFDPYYNTLVSIQMARDDGWYTHWYPSYHCWGR